MIEAPETPSQPWPSATTVTLGEEPWTSQTGENDKKKKKSFGRESLRSFNPFYTHIQFSSKATSTGNEHPDPARD